MDVLHVIKSPLVTEKTDRAREKFNQYSFIVDQDASKYDVAAAVKAMFSVTVTEVQTSIMRGKTKRVGRNTGKRPNFKKAVVTLKTGEKIPLFEGGQL